MKRGAGLFLLALGLAACTAPGQPPAAASAQSVALKSGDVPKGMVLCGDSGDIDSFLKGAPSNNQLATEIQQNWQSIKQMGVKHGVVNVFANTKADCDNLFTTTSSTATAPASVMGMTVEFKKGADAVRAQGNLTTASIAQLPGAEEGDATGLGKRSLSFGDTEGSTSIYFAEWVNGRFLDLMIAVDISVPAARKAAINVNSRIH